MYGTYLPKYNLRKNIPSSFTIDIEGVKAGTNAFEVALTIEKVASTTATDMVLHVVVTESDIPYNWQGQTMLHNVARLMVPNQLGTPLDFSGGDMISKVVYFEMEPNWVIDNSEVIVFIQNTQNKEVLQGSKRHLSDFGSYDIDASARALIAPQTVCMNSTIPKVVLANNGLNSLTSLDIVYDVNGGAPMTYSWTGNLATYESEIVVLDEINFALMEDNSLNISCENPNGQTDEFPLNNVRYSLMVDAPNVTSPVSLALKMDDYPAETTWELLDSDGNQLYSGGPYSTAGQFVIQQFDLSDIDCYSFYIYDEGGDGLTGLGSYKLAYQGSNIFAEGKNFGLEDQVQFGIGLTGIENQVIAKEFTISPNPIDKQATVSFMLENPEDVNLKIYNMVGKIVYESVNSYSSGLQNINIERKNLDGGIYFVQLSYGDNITTKKVILK
ncbi:MAG: T9SS type A sorting domain-containing protein [Bacteroidales bacterium]